MIRKITLAVCLSTVLLVTSATNLSQPAGSEGPVLPVGVMKAQAQVVWPDITFEQVNLPNLASPVFLTHAGDGSDRIFIVERAGRIRLVKNGVLQQTPFLDITSRVRSGGEEGLLSVAFAPDYAQQRRFYVYYTKPGGESNVVARFSVSANPDLADPASEVEILELPHPTYSNHNGGQLAFGPDGYLYVGPGDGGGGGDPFENAQNPASLLGKILRIDVEPRITAPPPSQSNDYFLPMVGSSTGLPYRIPVDNPFVGRAGYRPEIWAIGLRNPWRFSFDRDAGNLYIADVGQNEVEEVNFQPANSDGGENYGWDILEGSQCYEPSSGCTPPPNYVAPVAEYLHGPGDVNGCSVTGGYIYRGTVQTDLQNIYFYADYCEGKVYGLKRENSVWESTMLLDTPYQPSSFGEDKNGELYLVALSGQIYHLISANAAR